MCALRVATSRSGPTRSLTLSAPIFVTKAACLASISVVFSFGVPYPLGFFSGGLGGSAFGSVGFTGSSGWHCALLGASVM